MVMGNFDFSVLSQKSSHMKGCGCAKKKFFLSYLARVSCSLERLCIRTLNFFDENHISEFLQESKSFMSKDLIYIFSYHHVPSGPLEKFS